LHIQVDFRRPGGDDVAKIPLAVMPARAGAGAKIAEIGAKPIPYPDPAPGEPLVREMQRRREGRLVAGISAIMKRSSTASAAFTAA